MALWGGRFAGKPSNLFKEFNDSLVIDHRLILEDIQGSKAWANAIRSVGIISEKENEELQLALTSLLKDVKKNPMMVRESEAEDVHSFVETELIRRIGTLGKKLHTGRSRNDQVATDIKLWCKKTIKQVDLLLLELSHVLLMLANREIHAIFPGYTHLQRAQPISFALWALAYIEMFERDRLRLSNALNLLDSCPLGSGALAGTAYAIDRELLANELGFATATRNSLDSVSDRDHVIEICSVASISMMHLSRMAEDLIFFNSGEAAFIELSDAVTSGSSLMPQKKNPDALELIRGKTGRVYGNLMAILTTMKALPLAYNKDMQEDKEGLFDSLDTWQICLQMLTFVLNGLKINHQNARQAAKQGYSNATELADYLVSKGIPFRKAHDLVGAIVLQAMKNSQTIENMSLEELKSFSTVIEDDVYDILTLDSCLKKRSALGGTSIEQLTLAIESTKARLNS